VHVPAAQSPPAQLCPSFTLQAPAASQVCVPAGQESGSSADATTTQWPAWPGRLQAWQASAQALSQQTPSTQVSPLAHWPDVAHGAAVVPFGWQAPPWQTNPAAQSKSPTQLVAQTPPEPHM
jgi:hypothetical protein